MTAPRCAITSAAACAVELQPRPRAAEPALADNLQRLQHEAQRGSCDTGRYRCPYYSWGSGPPLVFVPGMANDAFSFALLIPHLTDHFRCIAYDLPVGRGDGARLDRYRHADLADDVFALLDHLRERQCYLFGFSFGSTIALAAMRSQPERVARAILQGGFACRKLAPAEVLLARLMQHWQAPMRQLPFFVPLLRHSHFAPFADLPPEVWRFFVERSGAPPIAAFAHRALLLHTLDLTPQLPEVRQPVLIVSGDSDPLVDAPCTDVLRKGLPSATHVELTACGHFAIFTHAGVLADVVRQFLMPACAAIRS